LGVVPQDPVIENEGINKRNEITNLNNSLSLVHYTASGAQNTY